MFNTKKLDEAIAAYKISFPKHWKDEMYKWEAVKYFQEHWDINTSDFKSMLEASLSKTYNLLGSGYYYPRQVILTFAEEDPEATRSAFIALYDESKNLTDRIAEFQAFADDRKENHHNSWNNHFQNTNAISTYLWLRYPEKYYIYKYSEFRVVSKELESDFIPKKSSDPNIVVAAYKFYDEICDYISKDPDLREMLESALTENCYKDSTLRILTGDIGFFISRYYTKAKKAEESYEWWPSNEEYTPGFSKDKWLEILNDERIIGQYGFNSLAQFYDYGGEATCTQIGEKYNRNPSSVSGMLTNFAKRVHTMTQCPILEDSEGKNRYWTIPFIGRSATSEEPGNWVWKLRPELYEALGEFDILRYLNINEDPDPSILIDETNDGDRQYWWLNASPKIWSFSNIAIGEEQSYSLYNDNGNKRRIFQNFLDAKAGDYVIGYEANPVKQIVALGRIVKENDGKELPFAKTEGLSSPIDYADLKAIPELADMEFFKNSNGSLFKLTKDEYEIIMDLIRESNPIRKAPILNEFTKKDFLSQVYMSEERYSTLTALLRHKKNVILQGAPGVGKTFTAKRLAYSMMGKIDDSRINLIQFHQNYSYEDFIMGYKPDGDSFKLTKGIFYQFCQKAADHPSDDYFFIIDEINRGNLSKIFGELLMLIEKDYRKTEKALLAYTGAEFSVPDNLYIIGMMNTADRSLALIDYALRRRFGFFDMEPGFNSDGFIKYQAAFENETFDTLIDRIKELNKEIEKDDSLGKGFMVGHSYFCGWKECTEDMMQEVVRYDLIPMLREYWFDDKQKLQKWENALLGVFND